MVQHNRVYPFIFLVLSLFILFACSEGDAKMEVEISPTNKNIIELSSQIYNKEQLMDIVAHEGSLKELSVQYPVECIRQIQGYYRIAYLGNDMVAILMFNQAGDRVLANTHILGSLKCDFSNLKVGNSLSDAQIIDPNGEYLFLYTGRNDIPRTSSHYTKDGYLITIEYDLSNTITSIREELI